MHIGEKSCKVNIRYVPLTGKSDINYGMIHITLLVLDLKWLPFNDKRVKGLKQTNKMFNDRVFWKYFYSHKHLVPECPLWAINIQNLSFKLLQWILNWRLSCYCWWIDFFYFFFIFGLYTSLSPPYFHMESFRVKPDKIT